MKKIASTIALLCLLLCMTACTNSGSTTTEPVSSNPASTPAEIDPATEPETDPETEGESTYSVGDTVELKHWSITLDNFELTAKIDGDYSVSYSPEDGAKYGVVSLTVVNNDTTTDTFLPTFSLNDDVVAKIYSGEYEFSASNLLGHSSDMHDTSLNPLMSSSGIIAFEVPDSIAESDAPLVLTLSCSRTTISFELR